ncbi:hypothetical protein XCR1_1620007 [Xenorhabdus cabanillasii JM26]|uniref:Uncharacterized protein n=1 Tax=Xenorhabdus cabanillasii JM26 TaxID=1427517 RepID=W1IVX5_9GAMM|nr:hypothetical protein XCR1_1620007 [Xenorhabdus cabanillasii JM26]
MTNALYGWSTTHVIAKLLWLSHQQRLISDANPASLLSLLFKLIATTAEYSLDKSICQIAQVQASTDFSYHKERYLLFFRVFFTHKTTGQWKILPISYRLNPLRENKKI